ncbi:MAG: NUDIX domain-containing protein [Bdellovibrionales bacterium]|nr:NUDIX domain-containing protein [Bdellovibrionales bacterium]
MNNKLPLRPNVCLLIYNQDRKLFVGERAGSPGVWQLPQGGVGKKNSLEEAALREAHEEMGVPYEMLAFRALLKATHEYEFSDPPHYALNKWRGQKQNFCLIEFTGSDQDIDLEFHEPEFSNFQWIELDQVLSVVEEKRRAGYRPALEEFKAFANS